MIADQFRLVDRFASQLPNMVISLCVARYCEATTRDATRSHTMRDRPDFLKPMLQVNYYY
jgi:hypothetical protein